VLDGMMEYRTETENILKEFRQDFTSVQRRMELRASSLAE